MNPPARTQNKRLAQGERSRGKLLRAAGKLFAERGYAGTSVDDVCREAKVVKSAVYWHFESKEGLLSAVLDEVSNEWLGKLAASVEDSGDPREHLRRTIAMLREAVVDRPDVLGLLHGMALERARLSRTTRAVLVGVQERARAAIADAIARAIGTRPNGLDEISALVLSTFDGILMGHRIRQDPAELDRMFAWFEHLVGLLVLQLLPMPRGGGFVGRERGPREFPITASAVRLHAEGCGDRTGWRDDVPPVEGELAPAALLHSESFLETGWFLPNLVGSVTTRQEWDFVRPLRVGQRVRTHANVVERYEKRDREYVVNEITVTDLEGRLLQRGRTHQSFLLADAKRRPLVDPARGRRPCDAPVAVVGPTAAPPASLERRVTHGMCQAFSGPVRNMNNDRSIARARGFPDIVVSGMMTVCLASELMGGVAGGAAWQEGGRLDLRLVNPVWVDDVVVARARAREDVEEGGRTRRAWDVWCEKADGTIVTIGSASAFVRGD
ncbi:MAG: TetR family transcriptional regulator [Alphaproteobacteria bacterium]